MYVYIEYTQCCQTNLFRFNCLVDVFLEIFSCLSVLHPTRNEQDHGKNEIREPSKGLSNKKRSSGPTYREPLDHSLHDTGEPEHII